MLLYKINMKSFYKVIDSIRDVVKAEPFNHEVTFGDIADIDLIKAYECF